MDRALYRPLENRRILIVEDDPIIALDLQSILETAWASGARSFRGHQFIEGSKVSAAVLDYRLQVGDTVPLARILAERGIPFLFETSDPDSVARKSPAIILAKPFRPDQLTSAMGALLARMQEARSFVDPTSGFAARS